MDIADVKNIMSPILTDQNIVGGSQAITTSIVRDPVIVSRVIIWEAVLAFFSEANLYLYLFQCRCVT